MSRTPRHRPGVFELSDARLGDAPPNVFGLWTPARPMDVAGATFDTAAAAQEDALTWRVNLPPNLVEAHSYLAIGTARLETSQRVLDTLAARLDARQEAPADPGAVTFSTGAPADDLAARLPALLRELQQGGPAANIDPRALLSGSWDEAARQLQAIVGLVRRMTTNYAWVETRLDQRILARTAVGWAGDTNTFLLVQIGPPQVRIHQRALWLALRSRALLLRTLIFALQLSTALGAGSPLIALPVTWRYLNGLVATLNQRPPDGSPAAR